MSVRWVPLAAVTAAAMAMPASAAAKQIESAAVCGVGGCNGVEVASGDHSLIGGSRTGSPPAGEASFFRIRAWIGHGSGEVADSLTTIYVPSAAKLRGIDGTWFELPPATARALARASRGLEPFPAESLDTAVPRSTSGRPLPPEVIAPPTLAAGGGGGVPAWILLGVAAGLIALLLTALRALRLRGGGSPRAAAGP